MRELKRNLLVGLSLGLFMAAGLSLWITFLRVTLGTAPFDEIGVPYTVTVLLYMIGFGIGGILIGALLPLRRWALGSMLLGMLFTFPVYATFLLAHSGLDGFHRGWKLAGLLIGTLIVGGGLGLWVWSEEGRRR